MQTGTKVQQIDLDRTYVCHDCLAFLFSPHDLSEHQQETGHKTAAKIKIDCVVNAGDKRIVMFELSDENVRLQH